MKKKLENIIAIKKLENIIFFLGFFLMKYSNENIEMIQKIVGEMFKKPLVDFKNPLEVIPRTIAKSKKK